MALLNTYNRHRVEFTGGSGAWLKDSRGKKYLDLLSGLGVNNLGYGYKKVQSEAAAALKKPLHVSNLFTITSQEKLGKLIQKGSFPGATFFCNSGAEANEAALKYVLKYGKTLHKKKTNVLSALNSFHGRTTGSLSLTGQLKYQEAFKPLLKNIKYFELNNIKDFQKKINSKTAGVFLEIIQGEGGVIPAQKEFLKAVRSACDRYQALLIIDEVQTGMGRTGNLFAWQGSGIVPDGFTLAKSLAGGFPIGAFTINKKHQDVFVPGDHASTFGGNPFSTAVGVKVIQELGKTSFLKEVKAKGKHLRSLLEDWQQGKIIKEIRGAGLMVAIEFYNGIIDGPAMYQKAIKDGYIINAIGKNIIRLLPPLVITRKELENAVNYLKKQVPSK